jgi:hypothetical protein
MGQDTGQDTDMVMDMDMGHMVPKATTTRIFIPKKEEDTVEEEDIPIPVLVLIPVTEVEVADIDGRKNHEKNVQQ